MNERDYRKQALDSINFLSKGRGGIPRTLGANTIAFKIFVCWNNDDVFVINARNSNEQDLLRDAEFLQIKVWGKNWNEKKKELFPNAN